MKICNTPNNFGLISVLFHWGMALLIAMLSMLGLYMVSLPDAGFSTEKIVLVLMHKEFGLWVLIAVIARLVWRFCNRAPMLPDTVPQWQKITANMVHELLYFFMLALPLTGWLMSDAGGYPVFFGGYVLPDLIAYNFDSFLFYKMLHKWLAYALIITVLGHAAAAFYHHFLLKDDVLRRMIFFWK